jgi:hypothetical protein
MVVGPFELSIFLTASAERSEPGTAVWAVAGAAGGVELVLVALFWLMIRRRNSGPSDPGPGDGGGGGGLRKGDRPKSPSPVGPVCWPEFERQFAEYVAARDRTARDGVASQVTDPAHH